MKLVVLFVLIASIGASLIDSLRSIPLPLLYAGLSRHKGVLGKGYSGQSSSSPRPVVQKINSKDWFKAGVVARGVAR